MNEGTITTSATGLPAVEWNLGGWNEAKGFVEARWPDAQLQREVGHWRIPHVANIYYAVGHVTYVPMKGHPLPKP